MTWEVGTPTDKSGPAYRTSRKRQFLKYVGAAAIGFGGGTAFTRQESTEGIVSAFGSNTTTTNDSTTGALNQTQAPASGGDPAIEGIASIDVVRGQQDHVLVSVTVSNPRDSAVRGGLYVTIRHEPYESNGDRIVELSPQSRQEYLIRVPRAGQMRNAVISAVENDDHEIDTRLGPLPERYGDA